MTRDEFLRELRIGLQGRIPQKQVNEQLEYYKTYIIEESRKERTQEEVLSDLGSPRLIAKTIADTYGGGEHYEGNFQNEPETAGRKFWFGSWYGRILAAIIFGFSLILIVKIGILILPAAAAVFMIGSMFGLIFKLFFGNKK